MVVEGWQVCSWEERVELAMGSALSASTHTHKSGCQQSTDWPLPSQLNVERTADRGRIPFMLPDTRIFHVI